MLNIIGGVCLLLWGLRNVRVGMTRAFGADLHRIVSASTGNRFTAFFSGIGVTALLQSSTATALIVAAFCGRGMIALGAGLAVMLGADVGTTLVAQLLSFDLSWLAPLLIIAGFVLFSLYERSGKVGHIGKFLLGLGLMLFALGWIRQSALPLQESETLALVLKSLEKDPFMAVVLTALLTWMAHSSLAVVLLLVSFVMAGVLPVDVGLVMVLGANIGGCFAPIFATMKGNREGCRVPVGNLIMRLIGVLAVLPFMDVIQVLIEPLGSDPERMIVNFHTAFNVGLAVLFLPFTPRIARLCVRLIPPNRKAADPGRARYLDEKQLDTPSVALSSAMRETLRMADIAQNMLEDTILTLKHDDEMLLRRIRKRDDILDKLNKSIKMYMARLSQESLDPEESYQYVQILGFSTNIESAGDTIDKSLMEMARKKINDKVRFSNQGWEDICSIHDFVVETMRLAQSVFVSGDSKQARRLVERKEELRIQEVRATASHIERIREGVPETIATSSLHLDIIRDLRRINSYMTAVAYPILEEAGQLRSSRLRPVRKKRVKKEDKEAEGTVASDSQDSRE